VKIFNFAPKSLLWEKEIVKPGAEKYGVAPMAKPGRARKRKPLPRRQTKLNKIPRFAGVFVKTEMAHIIKTVRI